MSLDTKNVLPALDAISVHDVGEPMEVPDTSMTTIGKNVLIEKVEEGITNTKAMLDNMKRTMVLLLLLSPAAMQAQDVQFKPNAATMTGSNTETKQMMLGANLELMSVGNDTRRFGAGINPAVYFDEKMSGKLGSSVQVTRKFDKATEIRAILGSHGGKPFIGLGGKVALGGRKKG